VTDSYDVPFRFTGQIEKLIVKPGDRAAAGPELRGPQRAAERRAAD